MSPDPPHPSREELFAYRDGELAAERRTVVEAHVVGCRACRETIDEVSGLEADLRARPDDVGERYYERLTEAILTKVASEDRAPRFERRKPEREAPVEEEKRAAPRLPWAAVISTASAAAAVLLVVGVLMRQGAVWRSAPRPSLLEKSAPDAGTGASDSALASAPAAESQDGARADKRKEGKIANLNAAPGGTEEAQSQAPLARDQMATQKLAREAAPTADLKDEAERQRAGAENQKQSAAAPAPVALKAAGVGGLGTNEPVSGDANADAYGSLIRRYGLPPVWEAGRVSNDGLRRAEPGFRYLYRTGGAGSDSARVRLYLAEAMRLKVGAQPDSAAYDEIVRHYRRAIRLAGADSAVAIVAARRLQEFLEEVGPAPPSP